MLGKLTDSFRRIDVSVIEAVWAHDTVWFDRTSGRHPYRLFQ
jgi:hypothetical protein